MLAARGDSPGAVAVLRRVLEESPAFEMAYVTPGRIYVEGGQRLKPWMCSNGSCNGTRAKPWASNCSRSSGSEDVERTSHD